MTQSKDNTITIDLSDYSLDSDSSFVTSSSMDSSYTITSSSIDTDNISEISFDWGNINIVPVLWTEALPDVDTVNAMCNEYPALAKAYENFQTVYKLVEQDYKGKKEDLDL